MIKRFGLISLLMSALLTTQSFAAEEKKEEKKPVDVYKYLAVFGETLNRAKTDYVEEVGEDKLIENAINGMLSSLDPHSSYLDAKSFQEMQEQTKGEFGGLGIEVTMDSGWVKVVSPIDDTPAFKAGIQAGDYITHIEGQAVLGLTLTQAVEKMRGPVKTKVKLTIRRKNADPFDVVITRDNIKIKSVKGNEDFNKANPEAKYKNIGYLRISQFMETTTDDLKKLINEIKETKKKNNEEILGYIIDLRNNPGGLLDQAIKVSDLFLDKGEIVSTRPRDKSQIQSFSAEMFEPGDIIEGLPLVVLINEGSASASEIVSGALQDHKRAIVAGMKSFGKGSVQSVIPINGMGAIRLTTARYYTPSGRSIQAKGIEPDIVIPMAKLENLNNGIEELFSEAALPNALAKQDDSKDNKKDAKKSKKDNKSLDKNDDNKNASDDKQEKKIADYQLDRACDIVRAMGIYHKK
ncbi:MAG: S41 family peptidase [Alphaproteobacteria bacterium]|nr:S41 family peptidase [Alphaproteobacteria bacterium]